MLSSYHAKYYAHELTRQVAGGDIDRLSTSLFDASVDLNPHQIEAALFALRSPLSKGVILADEVGLGKTIEAGLVLCQYWAEKKRKLIIICPASLRRQWAAELSEKFNLPTVILDAATLRHQVLEYIRYTRRRTLTQPFTPGKQEQRLYDDISTFLMRDESYALPASQRHLTALILRKLLASSTRAVTATLERIHKRLIAIRDKTPVPEDIISSIITAQELEDDYIEDLEISEYSSRDTPEEGK